MEQASTLVVRGGHGTLALRRGPSGTALLVEGRPAVVAWRDPTDPGQTWLVRAHDLGAVEASSGDLDLSRGSLVEALRPVLRQLEDGRYVVHVSETPDVARERCRTPDGPASTGRLIDWAGLHAVPSDERALVGTVARDAVPEARVRALVRAIRAGRRPAVVALAAGEGDVACVIAGHAALEAWVRLGSPPLLVRVDAATPPELDEAQAEALLVGACDHVTAIVRAHWRAVHPRTAPIG